MKQEEINQCVKYYDEHPELEEIVDDIIDYALTTVGSWAKGEDNITNAKNVANDYQYGNYEDLTKEAMDAITYQVDGLLEDIYAEAEASMRTEDDEESEADEEDEAEIAKKRELAEKIEAHFDYEPHADGVYSKNYYKYNSEEEIQILMKMTLEELQDYYTSGYDADGRMLTAHERG